MPLLYLVRHGQPDFAGNYDSITELGARQSSWLGAHFTSQGLRFARVVSGTLRRQVETCDLILGEMDEPPVPVRDARFNEYDHASLLSFFEGDRIQALRAAGDRRAYFKAMRHALQQWSRHEGAIASGESWAEFGSRIEAGLAAVCDGLERDDKVLVVSSGGVIGRQVSEVLGAGTEAAIQLNLQTRNTGITEVVRGSSGRSRLVCFNAIPHLERPDRHQAITFA